jgi:integrase
MQARRYQYGDLRTRKRKKGPDVWQFRFFDESGKRKTMLIGTTEKYPNKADAERAVEHFRMKVNSQNPQQQFHAVTVKGLAERYKEEELPSRYSTRVSYLSFLNGHIIPRWGTVFLEAVRPLDVEAWLRQLHLANKTKAHIRGMMHVLFQCARRWGYVQENPIELVRQSARRRGIPRVITPAQFCALVSHLKEPYRTMVLVAGCLGLRASEVTGLKWQDINWDDLTVIISQSVVHGREGEAKTEASEKPIPLDPELATELLKHRERSVYIQPSDYVFAGDSGKPRWQETILADHIKPAAAAAKIPGKVGWHTLRHTYSSLLRDLETDVKVQQELLRHADISTTLNIYTQAVSKKKRKAARKAVKVLLKDQNKKGAMTGPQVVRNGTF